MNLNRSREELLIRKHRKGRTLGMSQSFNWGLHFGPETSWGGWMGKNLNLRFLLIKKNPFNQADVGIGELMWS